MPAADTRPPVLLAAIAGAHGVRGLVKLRSFTADPADVTAYGPLFDEQGRRYVVHVRGQAKADLLAEIEGVGDRDAASALKGTRLYVARDALPDPDDEEFYHADLIGLAAEAADGRALGRVAAVHNHGAGDILEIQPAEGRSELVPFTRDAVPVVDIPGGRVVVTEWPGDE
jgi:16S rRNA processing protein RimM